MKGRQLTIGWIGHVLTGLAVITFLAGSIIIGYVAWILSTSVSIQRFQSGTLILTYIVIGVGFTLFFTGLIGWVAGASETPCILQMFIVLTVVTILGAIGLGLTAAAVRIELEDIFRFGWLEVNQSTRNLIQSSLNCCGFKGPREFADNNYHLDPSCYELFQGEKRLKQASCSTELQNWFRSRKGTWIGSSIALFIVQILSIVFASLSLHSLRQKRKSRRNESRSSSNRHLYSPSDGTNETFRDSL